MISDGELHNIKQLSTAECGGGEKWEGFFEGEKVKKEKEKYSLF
jgi:hypothetical protein